MSRALIFIFFYNIIINNHVILLNIIIRLDIIKNTYATVHSLISLIFSLNNKQQPIIVSKSICTTINISGKLYKNLQNIFISSNSRIKPIIVVISQSFLRLL